MELLTNAGVLSFEKHQALYSDVYICTAVVGESEE